jgi:hypothetical protein
MLVFGGEGHNDLNDLWELAFLTTSNVQTWRLISPAGTPPAPCSGHSAIYDPVGDRMIVFGYPIGLWELTLSGFPTWNELHPLGPQPPLGTEHSAIYDPIRERMVLFGGTTGDNLWTLDLSDPGGEAEWSTLEADGIPADGFKGHTAILDPDGDRMIVFGARGPAVNALVFHETAAVEANPPAISEFSLEGSRPNPAFGELTVFFALPSAAPTMLELIDVTFASHTEHAL